MYKKILRKVSQGSFIVIFFFLLKKLSYPVNEKIPFNIFFRIDSLHMLFTTISTLYFSYLFLPSLFIIILLIFLGNFFCFWVCPFGGIAEFSDYILLRKKWKIGIKIPGWVRKIRIFIFLLFILTAFITIFLKIPHLFWIFDPYVIITRAFIFKKNWMVLFIFIIVLSILIPKLWCNNICPLGYFNYLIGIKLRNRLKKLIKNEKKGIFKNCCSRRIYNFNRRKI